MESRIDGTLRNWHELAKEQPWKALLLGNGLSIHVWPDFRYRSLFERAKVRHLSNIDQKLFKAHNTENFEVVLAALDTTVRTVKAFGSETQPYHQSYRSIQAALGEAVRGVHIELASVPREAKEAIKAEMERHRLIFTTSYDLLVYWSMLFDENGAPSGRLKDFFWSKNCDFDPHNTDPSAHTTGVLFLHGALHLVVSSSGVTRKLRSRQYQTLLKQFGKPVTGDPGARPLLISEGSSHDKLRAIESNDYLGTRTTVLANVQRPARGYFDDAGGEGSREKQEEAARRTD